MRSSSGGCVMAARFRVIKNFVDPEELELRRLGWDCTIRRDDIRGVYGEAHLVS